MKKGGYGHCFFCMKQGLERYEDPYREINACWKCGLTYCTAHVSSHKHFHLSLIAPKAEELGPELL